MARRFKTATLLNLVGLVVAFTAFYFVMTQINYDRNYNRSLKDYRQLYRLEFFSDAFGEWWTNSNRASEFELSKMPQVESVSVASSGWQSWQKTTFRIEGKELQLDIVDGNNTVLTTLGATPIDGSIEWTDSDREGVIIAESVAKQFFGTTQATGKVIETTDSTEYTVRGVYADFADNATPKNTIIRNIGNNDADEGSRFSNYNYTLIAKLRADADMESVATTLGKVLKEQRIARARAEGWPEEEVKEMEEALPNYRLNPLKDTYFSGTNAKEDKGNNTVLRILMLAAVLIIVVAAINFLNLTLAASPMRIRGLNTRRILGSSRRSLILSLMAEGIITAVVACLLALVLCQLLSTTSLMAELTKGNTQIARNAGLLVLMLVVAVIIGILATAYPARYATSVELAMALKGSFGLTPKGRSLRTLLLLMQLFVSMLLVVYICILQSQSHYIFKSDYGFDKDEILYMQAGYEQVDRYRGIEKEIAALAGVESVATSQTILGDEQIMEWGRSDDIHKIETKVMPCTWNYLRTMGIKLTDGRDFNEQDQGHKAYIMNEAARRAWDWVRLGSPILTNDDIPVIGVCENVRAGSVREDNFNAPMVYMLSDNPMQLRTYNIRAKAGFDKTELRRQLEALQSKHDDTHAPEVKFLDNYLEEMYKDELRFIRQVTAFSLVCLVITLIGVFCLTMFETEYRRKEIGLRKVFGSTTREILGLLCRRYLWMIAVAFVVAAPIAWRLGSRWLEGFADRAPIHWWLFPLSLATVGSIMLLTVILQSWKTANENPVNSIKNE